MPARPRFFLVLALVAVAGSLAATSAAEREKVVGANWSQAKKFDKEFIDQHAQTASVSPAFVGKTDVFWYAVRTPDGTKYWKVDPAKKTKTPLFDHATLLAQLSELAQKPLDGVTFQLRGASVTDDGGTLKFVFGTTRYEYDLTAGTLKKAGTAAVEPPPIPQEILDRMTDEERQEYFDRLRERREQQKKDEEKKDEKKKDDKKENDVKDTNKVDVKKEEKKDDGKTEGKKGFPGRGGVGDYKAYSPDKKLYLYAFKYNLYLAEDGKEKDAKQLTTDGEEDYGYGVSGSRSRSDGTVQKPQPSERKSRPPVTWSKDSKRFTVTRTDRRGTKELFLVDSIAQPRPALERYLYSMPGEPAISKGEVYVGDAAAKTLTRLKPKWKDETFTDVKFGKTSDEIEFIRRDRLRRNHEYCRVNVKTGEEKCLIAEGFEAAYLEVSSPRLVEDADEVIWWSERSGWGHFYLYDRDGKLKNPITGGEWRASRLVDVDAKNRLIYFLGNAREAGENVYYTHLYRVRFDGSDLTNLTPGDATHRASLSPSKQFVVDTFSRVDLPAAAVLRDDKGQVVMELEKTDTARLETTGWKRPTCFTVKAADGMTDLYGNLWRPFDFDDTKKYPIIVYVYPGPQQEGVTHTFSAHSSYQQLAQLGFIVIQVGHRGGTPERSKAYHSYGYFNLRDYGLVDKKAAIEALAARHPWIDIDRVGIYGHSGGGFMSGAAMLQTPYNEFFKAAVASAGNHDNNIYNNYWSETYHGLKEVPIEAKKDGTTQGTGTGRRGGTGQRKNPPDDGPTETEMLPPPRPVTPWADTIDDIKKQIAALQKEVSDALAKGDAKQETIDALTAKMSALVKQFDEAKKGTAATEAKKQEVKKGDEKKGEEKKGETKEPPKTRFDIKIPTNAELAANLKGHLLLVHGEIDNNVHPANTMRLVDALIKANKRFDLLIIPGARHGFGAAQPYFTNRMWDFFAEHLLDDRQTGADIKDRDAKKK